MRLPRTAAATAAVLAAVIVPAHAQDHHGAATHVSATFNAYVPQHVEVLTGDTVTWRNDAARRHTVTAEDGSFDSGQIAAGSTYDRTFERPGPVPYYCRLHPAIRGSVDVRDVLLDTPAAPAAPGRPFPLTGRAAAAPGTPVSLEADTGAGFRAVAGTEVTNDGGFALDVLPSTTATYRAVVGAAASAPVRLIVLDRQVRAAATRGVRRTLITATVTPASPGATVVLQLRLRHRFGWWPVRRAKLDAASRVRFGIPTTRTAVPARVVLTLPDGATRLATSRTVTVGPARRRPVNTDARRRTGSHHPAR
jgi:plastocyanin